MDKEGGASAETSELDTYMLIRGHHDAYGE
jgi:hypothetical protein